MERRRGQRIKRRLPCEFLYGGHRHRGIVVDLSPGGLFLQTDIAVDPGSELEVHLSGSRFPEIELRAVVARRRFTPAVLATMIRRGVGLRILEAPLAYYEALETVPVEGVEEAAAVPIEIVVSAAAPPPETSPAVIAPTPAQALAGPPAQEPPEALEESETQVEEVAPAAQEAGSWRFEPVLPSDALVIDAGELDDVYELLVELGANPVLERERESALFRGWTEPPRLLVASARRALQLRVPSQAAAEGVVTVAVAEADSHTLCSMLRRQGFHYVVRRPVHPEALRLVLMRSLHREGERRAASRMPFGSESSWRSRWGRHSGLLIDLSSEGCRVLAREGAEPGSRVRIRIPREVADGRSLTLAGRVVRSEQRRGCPPPTRHAFALHFDALSSRSRERLSLVLQERSGGPVSLPRERLAASGPRVPPQVDSPTEAPADPPGQEPNPLRAERRRQPRGLLEREVVVLSEVEERVQHVLFGRDLSLEGLRVDPHPPLGPGETLRLAIYEPSAGAVMLEAEVVRDDGERGLVLRFTALPPPTQEAVARMVSALPSMDCEGPEGPPPSPVVIAEIVLSQP
ncbi:MAG: PilZ domain-containing protein [Myxococcota bacterium]